MERMKKKRMNEIYKTLDNHKLWLDSGFIKGERAEFYGTKFGDCFDDRVDLKNTDFRAAIIRGGRFINVDLTNADFRGADLSGTSFDGCDLTNADFRGADLSGVSFYCYYNKDIERAIINLPKICPEKGSFIGFKKAFTLETYANILKPWNNLMDQYIVEPQNQYTRMVPYIVELEIPEDAIRVSSSSSRKCRCSKAKVISITNLDGSPADVKTVYSSFDKEFAYTVGKTVSVDNFNINWWEVCASGIHFFITRQEAVDYNK